jgi:integral membrane protein
VTASPIPFLRTIGKIEAVSFLLLVGIAMPLKYFAGMPMAVKVVGWIHGVLFMIFGLALLRTWIVARWPFLRTTMVFIAALLPFGPFVVDRRMAEWDAEYLRARS